MTKFKSTVALALVASLAIMATPAAAAPRAAKTVCQKVPVNAAQWTALMGAAGASGSTLANSAGLAALSHSSGGVILSSIGIGGTGYLAGTLGGIVATVLSVLSLPAVIGAGSLLAIGAGGTVFFCSLEK